MSKKKMSVPDALWASIDLNRAIRRVAEAAEEWSTARAQGTPADIDTAASLLEREIRDLRRLKGEG